MRILKTEHLENFLKDDPVIVDVRPEVEFARGSIEGAERIDLKDIQHGHHSIPKDRPVLLVCERGMQSELAGLYLETAGYEQVWNLEGGLRKLDQGLLKQGK